jgi:hypothetical protein
MVDGQRTELFMLNPSKIKTVFLCQSCGYKSPRWVGKCPDCGTWNSMVEERVAKHRATRSSQKVSAVPLKDVDVTDEDRITSGIKEFDRVVGGGIVKGSGDREIYPAFTNFRKNSFPIRQNSVYYRRGVIEAD